jgi:nitrogen fixation-related uncharacterized protein
MGWSAYILVGFFSASLFFLAGAGALYWAHRNGQLNNLEKGARCIFDEDEPLGEITDSFPPKRKAAPPKS